MEGLEVFKHDGVVPLHLGLAEELLVDLERVLQQAVGYARMRGVDVGRGQYADRIHGIGQAREERLRARRGRITFSESA